MKKYETTKKVFAGLTKKHEAILKELKLAKNGKTDNACDCQNKKENETPLQKQTNRIKNMEAEARNLKQSIEQHKKNAAAAKQTEMKMKKEIANLTKMIEQQKEQHKGAKLHLEERIKQPYESKIGALEAALKNMEPLTIKFEKMKSDKSALQAEVLKLQKQVFSFEQEQGYLKEPIVPKLIELEKSYKQMCTNHQNEEKKLTEANTKERFNPILIYKNNERRRNPELSQMKIELDDKNNQIAKLRADEAITKEHLYNLSAENSSQIAKLNLLKNEIASVEKTAKLYFQMYSDERKINQNREDEKTGVFGLFRRK